MQIYQMQGSLPLAFHLSPNLRDTVQGYEGKPVKNVSYLLNACGHSTEIKKRNSSH